MLDGKKLDEMYENFPEKLEKLSLSFLIRMAITDEVQLFRLKEIGRHRGMIVEINGQESYQDPNLASVLKAQESHLKRVYDVLDNREKTYLRLYPNQ